MFAVKLENVIKSYTLNREEHSVYNLLFRKRNSSSKKIIALNNITFSIEQGEMIGIIGHNGSGKTTLLRLLAGVTNPTSGKIELNGKVVPILQLGSGFQGELSAIENIKLSGAIFGLSNKQIKDKLWEILEFAGLEEFATTPVKHFSSGMFARLAFAIAMQTDLDIFIFDEVLAVGDLRFQKKSYESFLSLREKKKTIVYVSHNLSQIEKFCDKAILLNEGKIEKFGEPSEVVKKYQEITKESFSNIDSSIAEKVSFFYRKLLNREPDDVGMYGFLRRIKTGEILLEDIPKIIEESDEYIKKHNISMGGNV